jgi:hypothetical protein
VKYQRWVWACLGLFVILACARSLEPAPEPVLSTAELMAREAPEIEPVTIGGSERRFRVRVPARLVGEVVPVVRADMVRLDIGAPSDVFCWFYHEPLNLAEGLVAQSNVGLAYIGRRFGSIANQRIDQTDAGVSAGRIFLAIDWRYAFEAEEAGGSDANANVESREGLFKVIASNIDGHSISCTHDALGYRASFRRVFAALIADVNFSDVVAPAPYYRKVELIELAGRRVGVRSINLRKDEAGDSEISIATSAVIPSDEQNLSSNDRYRLQYSTPDGAIINEFVAEAIDGKESLRLELAPRVTGGWNVKGTQRGKALAATLPGAILPSFLGQVLDLRRAIADRGVGADWRFESWMPTLDSSRLIESRVRITEERENEQFSVVTKSGPLSLDGISDARGSMVRSEVEIGATRMVVRQVWESGEI